MRVVAVRTFHGLERLARHAVLRCDLRQNQRVGNGEYLDRADVRRRLKKEVAAVVLLAMESGWVVRAFGHGVKVYCPCLEPDHGQFSIGGTPQNPAREAQRVRKLMSKCPKFSN